MRFASALIAATATAAAIAPASAHAFTPFTVYTSRAAYLAAVQQQGTTSSPVAVTVPAGTLPSSGTLGGQINYNYSSPGQPVNASCASLSAAPAGTGLLRATTSTAIGCTGGNFGFNTVGATQALGLTFVANQNGTYSVNGTSGGTTAAGQSYFAGIVFQGPVTANDLRSDLSVQFLAGNDVTITGFESAPAVSAVPEPATVALAAAGLAGVALLARRRRA